MLLKQRSGAGDNMSRREVTNIRRDLSWFERHNPGSHVSGWAAIVAGRGGEAENLFDQFFTAFAALGLSEVYVARQKVKLSGFFSQGRDHVVIHKQVGFDTRRVKAVITVDMRENERGDLLTSWFLFERDWFTAWRWFFIAILVFLLGISFVLPSLSSPDLFARFQATSLVNNWLLIWILVMGYLVGRGLGLWGRLYKTSPANPYERFDSAVLARYVDLTMKEVLAQAGVSDNEIEEVRFADASWIEERRERRVKE